MAYSGWAVLAGVLATSRLYKELAGDPHQRAALEFLRLIPRDLVATNTAHLSGFEGRDVTILKQRGHIFWAARPNVHHNSPRTLGIAFPCPLLGVLCESPRQRLFPESIPSNRSAHRTPLFSPCSNSDRLTCLFPKTQSQSLG